MPRDGSCFDGLMATGINRNQGAESILSLHLAALTMREAFGDAQTGWTGAFERQQKRGPSPLPERPMIQSQLHPLRLKADPSRVVVRPFHLAWQGNQSDPGRARRLVDQVLTLDDREIGRQLKAVMHDFEQRHWQTRKVFLKRFTEICALLNLSLAGIGDKRQQLIGAYFCHEYSYAAAALMNPSIVPHPDQSGLDQHTTRILMSLRAVGEGHISSIAFREGLVSAKRRAPAGARAALRRRRPTRPTSTRCSADGAGDRLPQRGFQPVGNGHLPGHPGAAERAWRTCA